MARAPSRDLGAYYRYFRITQEGPNSMGGHALQLSCFEIHGRLLCVRPYASWRQTPGCCNLVPRPTRNPDLPPMPEEPKGKKGKKGKAGGKDRKR